MSDVDKKQKPRIVMIAAVATENRVIGDGLNLPWHIPEDLKRFKRLTLGHPMIMGRRTFDSLVEQFGGPLKGRRLLILSGSKTEMDGYPDIEVYPGISEALAAVQGEDLLFIGGGGGIYEAFLPLADTLELTEVEGSYDGDTFFPPYQHLVGESFREAEREEHDGFAFVTYNRVCR